MGNSSLRNARVAKNDEFYTQLSTIENEVMHYRKHFKGKTVYLNCDDPRESNFFHYFSYNFERLGLKKLISSCYKNQNFNLFSMHDKHEKAVWLEYTGEKDGGRVPTAEAIGVNHFKGDGDFRSEESIELLKEADIVVTNPPFSLFREYIAQLMKYDKKFLVLGNMNAITYKEIFPLIKENKMWPGVTFNKTVEFEVPDYYDTSKAIEEDGKKLIKVPAISWWTNLDYPRRYQDIILFREYKGNEDKYPKYDNYDAINVDKVADIPKDYKGVMGVPITFIGQWNPEQFEVLGLAKTPICEDNSKEAKRIKVYDKAIQHNKDGSTSRGNKINDAAVLVLKDKPKSGTYYTHEGIDGYLVTTYVRVLIKIKDPQKETQKET